MVTFRRLPTRVGVEPLSTTLNLEVNTDPSPDQSATFPANIEALLAQASNLIDDGAFDHDTHLRDIVERDRNYLHAEVLLTDAPFALGEVVGSILARLERNMLSATDVPGPEASLVTEIVEVTATDSPGSLPDILDRYIETAHLDDLDWLAAQEGFDAYAVDIHDIAGHGARRWMASIAHLWHTDQAAELRNDTAWGATVGTPAGAANRPPLVVLGGDVGDGLTR